METVPGGSIEGRPHPNGPMDTGCQWEAHPTSHSYWMKLHQCSWALTVRVLGRDWHWGQSLQEKNKLPLQNEQTTSSHEQSLVAFNIIVGLWVPCRVGWFWRQVKHIGNIPSRSIYGIFSGHSFFLTIPGILSCPLTFYLHGIYFVILSGILSGIYSDILSIWHLFRRSFWQNFDILSGICIWYIFWHSFWLVYRMFFVVEVPWGTLRSSRWRSGGERSDPEIAVEVRRRTLRSSQRLQLRSGGDHSSDPVLAVRVWRRTLRSSACSWGPARITLILSLSLLFEPSREQSGGPAGINLILSLRWGSGRDHCDPALAVEVRRGTVWSCACCSGLAANTAI